MKILTSLIVFCTLCACAAWENEQGVELDNVPAPVMMAAKDAVPGITIEEAEMETENGNIIYELSGHVADKEYEIEVSPSGEVLKVEED